MNEYQSTTRTDSLQKRAERCVCRYCGGRLRVKSITFNEIVDGRTELFCTHCNRVEFGVEPEVYQSARYFVEEFDYNCFPDLDQSALSQQMSVAKVCDIMSWLIKHLGITDDDGFTVPIAFDWTATGQCLHLTDNTLAEIAADGERHG